MPSASITRTGCCIRLQRVGGKGEGKFRPISWDDALDLVAEKFQTGRAALTAPKASGPIITPAPWGW